MSEYKFCGSHLSIDLIDCKNYEILDDEERIMQLLRDIVKKVGATPLKELTYKFEPQGVSAVILLAESHIALYSYVEHKSAFFDLFTCGDTLEPLGSIEIICKALLPKKVKLHCFERGNL